MGDGALVEFPSVVEAVECAVEIQAAMPGHNVEVPEEKRIAFRIGALRARKGTANGNAGKRPRWALPLQINHQNLARGGCDQPKPSGKDLGRSDQRVPLGRPNAGGIQRRCRIDGESPIGGHSKTVIS